jgi:hypothetical protein
MYVVFNRVSVVYLVYWGGGGSAAEGPHDSHMASHPYPTGVDI